MLSKFKPSVSRQKLYFLAGILWTVAGSILCYRSLAWLSSVPVLSELGLEILSAAAALIFYSLFFSTIVHKSIDRISRLPEQVCMFAFTPWRGYGMIALMIFLGIGLRSSSIPKVYLSVPFAIMGITLLLGSIGFFRKYFTRPVTR